MTQEEFDKKFEYGIRWCPLCVNFDEEHICNEGHTFELRQFLNANPGIKEPTCMNFERKEKNDL